MLVPGALTQQSHSPLAPHPARGTRTPKASTLPAPEPGTKRINAPR